MENARNLEKQLLMFRYGAYVRDIKSPAPRLPPHPGAELRSYLNKLGTDRKSQFNKSIQKFIECTKSSTDKDSIIILTNIRQFMTGMKNFLHENGGKRYKTLIDEAKEYIFNSQLMDNLKQKGFQTVENGLPSKSTPVKRNDTCMVFDLDAILEDVMFDLVVEPLFDLILDALSTDCYSNVVDMIENSKDIAKLSLPDLGLDLEPFSPDVMRVVRHYMKKMQVARNPLDKIDYFLNAITIVVKSAVSCETGESASIYTTEVTQLLVWMLVHCGLMTAEMELIFIQQLIHPAFIAGETNFYIKALMRAVHVIKEPKYLLENYQTRPKHVWRCAGGYYNPNELKVLVPDPETGLPYSATIVKHSNEVTAHTVCDTMARKVRMRNPELCSLYKLVNGEVTILENHEKVLDILKEEFDKGNCCYFVYMYGDGQITWPLNTKPE